MWLGLNTEGFEGQAPAHSLDGEFLYDPPFIPIINDVISSPQFLLNGESEKGTRLNGSLTNQKFPKNRKTEARKQPYPNEKPKRKESG